MAEIYRVTTGAVVILVAVLGFYTFFSNYTAYNLPTVSASNVTFLSNGTIVADVVDDNLKDIITQVEVIQAEDTNLLTLGLAVVKGTLAVLKLPLTTAYALLSTISQALGVVGVPSSIIALLSALLITIVAFGILSVVSKAQT